MRFTMNGSGTSDRALADDAAPDGRAMPNAMVTLYEKHIPPLRLPDPNDCHVVAAGIAGGTVTAQVAGWSRNSEVCDQTARVGVQGLQDIPLLLPGCGK